MEKRIAWEKTFALRPVLHARTEMRRSSFFLAISPHVAPSVTRDPGTTEKKTPTKDEEGGRKRGSSSTATAKVFCGMKKKENRIKILCFALLKSNRNHTHKMNYKKGKWGYNNVMCRKKKKDKERKKEKKNERHFISMNDGTVTMGGKKKKEGPSKYLFAGIIQMNERYLERMKVYEL